MYRSCMTCKKVPGAPVCDPTDQTTPSGYGFLNVNTIAVGPDTGKIANMPDGFVVDGEALVPMMGDHAWNVANQPDAGNPFADPVWVMGTHDGRTVFYEPMIPLVFLVGDESKEYEESLTYVGQSVGELPAKYSASYDATSGYLTVKLSGKSAVCGKSANHRISRSTMAFRALGLEEWKDTNLSVLKSDLAVLKSDLDVTTIHRDTASAFLRLECVQTMFQR